MPPQRDGRERITAIRVTHKGKFGEARRFLNLRRNGIEKSLFNTRALNLIFYSE
jgi:hypothetical protein